MPTIELSKEDLEKLVGRKFTVEELESEAVHYVKGELEEVDGDNIKIEISDSNRPDLWSTEGIARAIKPFYTKENGIPKYKVSKGKFGVNVTSKVEKVRPVIGCAVIRDIKITEEVLQQMIQLQEKVAGTFGRKRARASIGVYDLDRITPPILYTTVKPHKAAFIPLEFKDRLTPAEILEKHPKGQEYGHLVKKYKEYPMIIDAKKRVLSMPPIINSDYSGKVTKKTKNLLIEVTGFDYKQVEPALKVMVMAMADRGGKIESALINHRSRKEVMTPVFAEKDYVLSVDSINRVSGLNLKPAEAARLLKKARYDVDYDSEHLHIKYPEWRQDIMHPIDIIEDAIIAYGYNKIEPEIPELVTSGEYDKLQNFSKLVREVMVGFVAQEIMTFTLTNKRNLFEKMNLPEERVIEIENPVSSNWSTLRNWMIPSMMEFLSRNTKVAYPQRIFEVGDCVTLNTKAETGTDTVRTLAYAHAGMGVNFTMAKQVLKALVKSLGMKYSVTERDYPSFIQGRSGEIKINGKRVGLIGEIHPDVLQKWGLEVPAVVFEIDLSKICPK